MERNRVENLVQSPIPKGIKFYKETEAEHQLQEIVMNSPTFFLLTWQV